VCSLGFQIHALIPLFIYRDVLRFLMLSVHQLLLLWQDGDHNGYGGAPFEEAYEWNTRSALTYHM